MTMQFLAHLIVDSEKVKILVQETKTRRRLKLRLTGDLGVLLDEESAFLQENQSLFQSLKAGEVVSL